MKKILLIIMIICTLLSCNNSEISNKWQDVDIEVKYMDSVKTDTLHLHIPLSSNQSPYEFDLYGDGMPYICLGYMHTYVACNVRVYRILKNIHN